MSLIRVDEGLADSGTSHLGTAGFKTGDGDLAGTKSDDVDVDKVEPNSNPSTAVVAGIIGPEVDTDTGERPYT